MVPLTAKQALIERVETMTDEEAAELLNQLEWESTEFDTLSDDALRELADAEAEVSRGEIVSAAEVLRRLGL